MSEHSRFFAPSSIARRIGCTASARMEADIVEAPSEYAQWGTAAHKICELCANPMARVTPYSLLNQQVEGVLVTREMVAACDTALAHMRQVTNGGQVLLEQKLSMGFAGIEDMFGTSDVVVDEPFRALIIFDYKFGQGVAVSAERNPALMSYALMAAGHLLDSYQRIILAISQPRISEHVQVWETTPAELAAWRDDVLIPAIKAIQTGQTSYNPTLENCRWCKAADKCPAYARTALATAQADFAGVISEPAITPDLVQQIYPQLPLLADFIRRVETMAMEMAGQGQLEGYKLVAGRGSRGWTDEAKVQELLENMGADPFEHKLLSPAKAEKLGKDIKKAITPYVSRIAGNPVIAPITDKRRALSTAQEDFQLMEN